MQEVLTWNWRGRDIQLGYDVRGEGPTVVMLPALSSISSRGEMSPISEHLSSGFRCIAVDLPGFGTLPRPPIAWDPDAYRSFVAFVFERFSTPFCRKAAGHECCRRAPRSKSEMQALSELPGISSVELPDGKLGVHEEFAAETAAVIRRFLLQAA